MRIRRQLPSFILSLSAMLLTMCGENQERQATHFTKTDSLTETYLELKDRMFAAWNMMMRDDNQKLKAMRNLVHELGVSNPAMREDLKVYEERIQELVRSRYTQESMGNLNAIEEYDFASNALISDLISLAESQPEFGYNSTLQRLSETIRTADQRVNNYREEYDRIASEYNEFIEKNLASVKEIEDDTVEKKPLFHMASEN